jgi:hypothetical protein
MTEGPFKDAFDRDNADVIRKELITYRVRNGMMIKEIKTREYYTDGDYHDSYTVI